MKGVIRLETKCPSKSSTGLGTRRLTINCETVSNAKLLARLRAYPFSFKFYGPVQLATETKVRAMVASYDSKVAVIV